jgi:hypothetical protein
MSACLDNIENPEELRALTSWKVHALTGERKGTWSLTFTRNDQLQQPLDSFRATPSLARISSIRHQRVSPDWSKFAPTNTVNHSQ